jgi:transcriptional regulator with PAS, ATPase and Fis domain
MSEPGTTAQLERPRTRENDRSGYRLRTALRGPAAAVAAVARRAAAVDCPLLIVGETGVGKGVLAKWIHVNSDRQDEPFVPVNCGAIPESLIDSDRPHLGLVRAAEGGTLLLDEVGELPLTAQTRLLRLLEEREAQPVGFSRPINVDVRIIVASNRDLWDAVGGGTFREDLYFRLDIVRVELKPLRQCSEEIPYLLAAFDEEFARLYGQPTLLFDRQALRLLRVHHWPGNVRELRTVVERLHVLGGGRRVTATRLRDVIQPDRPIEPRPASMDQAKLEAASHALAAHGSVTGAASALGVHRSTVYRWLSGRALTA